MHIITFGTARGRRRRLHPQFFQRMHLSNEHVTHTIYINTVDPGVGSTSIATLARPRHMHSRSWPRHKTDRQWTGTDTGRGAQSGQVDVAARILTTADE